jgi:hypothetical protein
MGVVEDVLSPHSMDRRQAELRRAFDGRTLPLPGTAQILSPRPQPHLDPHAPGPEARCLRLVQHLRWRPPRRAEIVARSWWPNQSERRTSS